MNFRMIFRLGKNEMGSELRMEDRKRQKANGDLGQESEIGSQLTTLQTL